MSRFLVIVESPSKCKTIQKYLSNTHPSKTFTVEACFGHIRDLGKKDLGIDLDKMHVSYDIDPKKRGIVDKLTRLVGKHDFVLLASDNDREGESIAWHLVQALKLKKGKYMRMVFNEITESAIGTSFSSLKSINMDLVNAQQTRRIIDRVVGFKLSPLLWKNFKVESSVALSAGRVQSVALGYVVDRESDIAAFKSAPTYTVRGTTTEDAAEIKLYEVGGNLKYFDNERTVLAFLRALKRNFAVTGSRLHDSRQSPDPPFITSTLQQEAAAKLGFSVKTTMSLSQSLYERGYITYMRTDSYALSSKAKADLKSYITSRWGNAMHEARDFTKRKTVKNGQEAHEAIRPTSVGRTAISGDGGAAKLYDLIWKRTVASQMRQACYSVLDLTIKDSAMTAARSKYKDLEFRGKTSVLRDPGYLVVYSELPGDVAALQKRAAKLQDTGVKVKELIAKQSWSGAPSRYNEAGLIKVLERDGIGRPSTYAGILEKLYNKNYMALQNSEGTKHVNKDYLLSVSDGAISAVEHETVSNAETNRLVPTEIGKRVNDYVSEHFSDIVDVNFTSSMEKMLDEIADGEQKWQSIVGSFWKVLEPQVKAAQAEAPRAKDKELLEVDKTEFHVGSNDYVVRLGKYGPLIEKKGAKEFLGLAPYLKLVRKAYGELEQSEVELLVSMPKDLGDGARLRYGRYGFYLEANGQNYMLPAKWVKQELGGWGEIGKLNGSHVSTLVKMKAEYLKTKNKKIKKVKK